MTDPIQPERDEHPTVEGVPYSVEDTGISNEGKIDQLLATAVTVRAELHDRSRKIAIGLATLGVAFFIALGAAVGVLIGLGNQADKLTGIAKENKVNGDIARENSDAILAATGPESRARSAATTIDIIRRNVIETDCRHRRAQVRLPAPDPNIPCDAQTDASVYPGVEGEPSR